ncbi:hypothetical protein CNMCM7691_003041 [Aspergillus felis]|uniref:Major facilitator superfamily (MFS) profile domain-containing protein n=1 Tax=Aspergillus felis TaxID=1287682 RepID=A0A8H6V623_9EURO|nr:hypothetical protein CNMCM7691_003041 [Aspergillus felis]
MVLTRQTRQTTSDDAFPTTQLFLLAICRVAEPIALTSIFPYSWVMVKDFRVADRTDASFYAGILVSAFSLAEALTGMFWGGLSDRIGRKPVLLSGCFGTILSLLLVGFAPNFWVALLGRALGGLLNGNIGVIQTMVGELVKRPEHEPRAYAVMPFVWSIGTIIGPAIGGLLAKPAESYPSLFSADGLFGKFPYLLPNLVCSLLLLLSIIGSWLFLYETHPGLQHQKASGDLDHTSAESPLLATAGATANAGVDLRAESYGTFNQVRLQADEDWFVNADGSKFKMQKQTVFTYRVVSLIIALSIFTYHSMTYDHLLPIFLQDKNGRNVSGLGNAPLSFPGGLGLSTRTVGLIMSSDGIIALIIQSCIFPILAQSLGIWRLFVVVTVLHPVAYFIVPFLMFVPQNSLIFGIYICLIIRNILSIIDYPVLLILIKQASPSESVMGKINGLAASAGAVARTIAPPIAGFLYSTGADMNFTAIAWWGSALVAVLGAVQLFFMNHKKHTSATIRSAMPCHYHYVPDESRPQKETIHIIVTDTDADADGAVEMAVADESLVNESESENIFPSPKKTIDGANTNTPQSGRYSPMYRTQDPILDGEDPESVDEQPSSPFEYDGRDATVDFRMLGNRQVSGGLSECSMTPRKRSYSHCPEDEDAMERSSDRSKKGMSRRDIPGIQVYADEEPQMHEREITGATGHDNANSTVEERRNEGMSTVLDEHNDYDDSFSEKENLEMKAADDQMNDDSHDLMDDTCFSTFSAVPNADMTSFAKLRGDSPFKAARLLPSSPGRTDENQSGSPAPATPGASRRSQRQSALIDIGTPIASPTPKRRERKATGNASETPNLLDLTDQTNFFPRQRYSIQKERYSPSRRSPLRTLRESIRSPSKVSLLDFDIPAIPTPRSIPTITPRELESLKSGFLSEISSLKATLSGKEAEVSSLKNAVADAERRVGEALEEVRNEAAQKEALEMEQAEWQRRGQEMEDVLRTVRADIVEGELEKERLMRKVEEAEKGREHLERRMVELESQLSAARKPALSETCDHGSAQCTTTAEETAREVQDAVEKVARELHTLYKSKHETKVAALKKSYEARWEKRVREAENKCKAVSEENERLKNERDTALSGASRPDASIVAHQNDEHEAEKHVLEAQIKGLQQEMATLKQDNERLHAELKVERAEKGELVAAVDEWLAIQQNASQASGAPECPIVSAEHETPEPEPTTAESTEEFKRSIGRSGSSGIRPASTGSGSGEKRIPRIGAPAGRHVKGNSGGKSGIAVFTPGRGAGGILGSIERMGRGGV